MVEWESIDGNPKQKLLSETQKIELAAEMELFHNFEKHGIAYSKKLAKTHDIDDIFLATTFGRLER